MRIKFLNSNELAQVVRVILVVCSFRSKVRTLRCKQLLGAILENFSLNYLRCTYRKLLPKKESIHLWDWSELCSGNLVPVQKCKKFPTFLLIVCQMYFSLINNFKIKKLIQLKQLPPIFYCKIHFQMHIMRSTFSVVICQHISELLMVGAPQFLLSSLEV